MTLTTSERVDEDGVTIRSMLVGTHETRQGMWQEWACLLMRPATGSRLILPEEPERAEHFNEEGQERGLVLLVPDIGLSISDRNAERLPDAAEVLQGVCQTAVNVENSSGDFWKYWTEYAGSSDARPGEADLRHYEMAKIQTAQLKEFLGDQYSDYLWQTEWE